MQGVAEKAQRATAVCPWGQRDSYTRREGSSLSVELVEEAEISVLVSRLVPVSDRWRSPLIPSATCPSCHAWPARWRLKSRRTWLSVELVLPGWFEADVGSLHLLTLGLLDVFVSLSLCTHNLVINITDQLLGSLERKDINTKWVDSQAARESSGTSRSGAQRTSAGQLGWSALYILL